MRDITELEMLAAFFRWRFLLLKLPAKKKGEVRYAEVLRMVDGKACVAPAR
jgi:hypothetical protein